MYIYEEFQVKKMAHYFLLFICNFNNGWNRTKLRTVHSKKNLSIPSSEEKMPTQILNCFCVCFCEWV